MAPLVLTLLQAVFLILLYLFVARAVRAVLNDLRPAPAPAVSAPAPAPPRRRDKGSQSQSERRRPPGELVVHVPGNRPRVLQLTDREVTFGRNETSTVMLTDNYVSERHARIYPQDGQWIVADLGSTNGTYLNKAKVERPTPLAAGDQLAIGKTTIEVRK